MISKFAANFTAQEIPFKKLGKNYFLISEELNKVISSIEDEPTSVGLFLGREDKKFTPSLALLQWLGDYTKRKAIVDEKAAWLFICGRDVFNESTLKCRFTNGLVLVCNQKEEILGYGQVSGKGISNNRHVGEYLKEKP